MIRVSLCDNGDNQVEVESREKEKKSEGDGGWMSDQRPIKMHGVSSSSIPIVDTFDSARYLPGGDNHLHVVTLNHL